MSATSLEIDTLSTPPYHAPDLSHSSAHEPQEINRSASYTSLPGLVDSVPGIKRTFSDNVLTSLAQKPTKISPSVQNANVELFRRASQKTKKRMSGARFILPADTEEVERIGRSVEKSEPSHAKSQGRGVGALKMFSRKTWLSSSRPGSPSRKEDSRIHNQSGTSPPKNFVLPEIQSMVTSEPSGPQTTSRPLSVEEDSSSTRDSVHSQKESTSPTAASRTVSEYSIEVESEASSQKMSRRTSLSSLRSRASIDRMYLSIPAKKVPPMPTSISPDRLSGQSAEASRRRDPYWIQFRSIDGDFAAFQSKTSLQKAKIVRTVLLPFLSKTCDRTTMDLLSAEDLDRRTVILNKWWTGLLDLLNGSGQQSISGTDRPAFLEAICELMFRPEWKMPPFVSSSAASTESNRNSDKADSSSSMDSEEPEFLVRTIHQNVRNTFLHNIIQQMAFVVDKLSVRSAPASLVIFGGKTCAYAFFYCPGIADLLARLWHIPPGTLRRVFAEYGPQSGRRAGIISKALASSFPPALRSMCFTSYAALSRQLQNKAQIPTNTAHIRWHGPWVNRWIGRDSDLFFVFVKHYHLLVAEHLPRHLLPEEKMGVPGLVVVHAQVLLNLESALYRQAGNVAAEHYTPPTGDNPDAMAPLPMVIPNATRSIGENRLVMLLRDCIGDRRPENVAMAEVLVGAFQYILKAAVRKVSMYNNDACFVLCDFLEELLPLVSKYQQMHVEDEDWEFWIKVYRQMLKSHTTMTQIRVIAFLYSMWPYLLVNEERKKQIVVDWLLEPQFFASYFSHWSPMVRHYFYRLVCWRIGRCDGPASDVDIEIYKRLQHLLNTAWAHHQYLTADAEMRDTAPPSTNPCSPAPGRMLLIIRIDNHVRSNSFTNFDKLMPSHANQISAYANHSSLINKLPDADSQHGTQKKRWSILKSIGLFSGPTNSRPGEVTPPRSPDTVAANLKSKQGLNREGLSRPSSPPHLPLTFRFTLEYSNVRPALPAKARRLPLPTLPHTSQKALEESNQLSALTLTDKPPVQTTVHPLKPMPEEINTARYSGRALTEWSLIVAECRNFYTRRKQEGCPNDRSVETPSIAVETFRMFG